MSAKTRLLAWIYIMLCGGCMVVGTVLCIGLALSHDANSGKALEMIGGFFASLSVAFFIPGLIGGVGLLRGHAWARVLIIVLSLLIILAIPVGTALGGFGLWVLLGKNATQSIRAAPADHSRSSPFRAPTFSPADRSRYVGILVAAAGVAAGFVVMIGTGYRVTHTVGSPIGDVAYVASVVVLVLTLAMGVRGLFRHGAPWGTPAANWRRRRRFAEERLRNDEAMQLRLAMLATDPVRSKYVERIARGEAWSDDQIEYDLHADHLATCEHLQPIERELRANGIEVRLKFALHISARCRVDAELLRAHFSLPAFVTYAEPQPTGRGFEDPLPALIVCAQCNSSIDVVHRADARRDTPLFPSSSARDTDASPTVDRNNDVPADPYVVLRNRIMPLARQIGVPAQMLPTYQWSAGTGLPHIEMDGVSYHYVVAERGEEFERFTTTSVDELLYRIFRDVAFSMAANPARAYRKPGEDFRRGLFREQLVILGRLNPEWASQCAAEHQEVLVAHPFVDKA